MRAVIRPSAALRAARAVELQSRASAAVRPFSATSQRAASHESQYDPPSGWLWGVKPGEKYQKEGWEGIFIWGFFGSFAVFAVAYAFKPDTSIQTWALEEARRRLEAEGILEDPFPDNKKEE